MQATIFRRTLSTVLALDMENTTLLDSRYALRDEMRHWLSSEQFSHFITLATHNPMCTSLQAKSLLDEWGQRVDHTIIGKKWLKRREVEGCEWVAFQEGQRTEAHWHVLFRISPDLRTTRKAYVANNLSRHHGNGPRGTRLRGLPWVAHDRWRRITRTGDAVTDTIYSTKAVNYASKCLVFPASIESYAFSPAYKRR